MTSRTNSGRSLRHRFAYTLALFVAAVMVAVTVLVATLMKGELERELNASLSASADHALERLEYRLNYLAESTANFAGNSLVVNSLVDPEGRRRYLEKLVGDFAKTRDVVSVTITDFEGGIIYSTLPSAAGLRGNRPLRLTLATGRPTIQRVAGDRVWIISPIEFYATPQGAVITETRLAAVAERVLPRQRQLHYRLATSTGPLWEGGSLGELYAVDQSAPAALANLRTLGVTIEVGKKRADFFRPIEVAILKLMALSLFAVVLAIIVAFQLGGGIAEPILTLVERVRGTRGGGATRCAPLGTADELEELAEAFDQRTGQLVAARRRIEEDKQRLEEEIAERIRTERALAEARDQAETASRAKSEFLAVMSHEIRTPMNAVLGMAELLSESRLDEEGRGYLEVQKRAGNALLALIDDILDLSKLETGKLEVRELPFQLGEMIAAVLSLLGGPAEEKGLVLDSRLAPELAREWVGDIARLRQILVNLVGNAIKFTDRGEVRIEVSADDQAGFVRFCVADTGIGIAAEDQASIFDAFTQADSSYTRRYGGTGLGLSITRHLVDLLGGRLWLESEPGRGSRFFFSVPLRPSDRRA